MGVNPSTGFTQVRPTADEKAAWDKRYPRQAGHYPYRSACMRCGTRIWHSGIGIGSHRRACRGSLWERAAWFHYHTGLGERAKRIKTDYTAWTIYTTWHDQTANPIEATSAQLRDGIKAVIAERGEEG